MIVNITNLFIMKKIILIHNLYREFGGEDAAFRGEHKLLKSNYQVKTVLFDNNHKFNIYDVINFLFLTNVKSNKIIKKEITKFEPDVVYIHNLWFKGSLGVMKVLKKYNLPIVIKLHNFRYLCANTYFSKKHLKGNKFCPACGVGKSLVFNKYFPGSYLKSFFVIRFSKKLYKIMKTYKLKILLLTDHHKQILIEENFSENNLSVLPNHIPNIDNVVSVSKKQFLYAGRISKEKGLEELIIAFLSVGLKDYSLKILGNGPDLNRLRKKYSQDCIKFAGFVSNETVLKEIKNSAVVISATKLYEGQPTLLCEASKNAIPVIFPNSGGIKEFLPPDYKFLFEQFNYSNLQELMLLIVNSDLNKIGEDNKKFINSSTKEGNLLHFFSKAGLT